jgi:hypothetical protein
MRRVRKRAVTEMEVEASEVLRDLWRVVGRRVGIFFTVHDNNMARGVVGGSQSEVFFLSPLLSLCQVLVL